MIAQAIVEGSPVLLLDEPTNHMDLDAVEVLEEALKLYKGIIICISHDRDFISKICNKTLELDKKKGIATARLL